MPDRSQSLPALRQTLAQHTAPGAAALCTSLVGKHGWVLCRACGHSCRIPPDQDGICKVRGNRGGTLQVPWGYVGALQCDPIEKKPFFHVLPGSEALSFGMLGCDYHCAYCQNWLTSQTLRDAAAVAPLRAITESAIIDLAAARGARVVASTYNEPLITSEWAVSIFAEARRRGLMTAYVSNGNGTPEVLDYLRPWLDLYKVDLKGFRQEHYREVGGVLGRVLETLEWLAASGLWLEVVTLVIPGFNDDEEDLRAMARFLSGLSPDIPWHVTAFHPDYRMTTPPATDAATLLRAVAIGREAGLRYVYAGNLPGQVGDAENTRCPGCQGLLVERSGYRIRSMRMVDGRCPDCQAEIPGRWGHTAAAA